MTTLKGSKTEISLLTTFAGESQARNRYTFFSSVARKEGFVQMANVFAETADQEKEHAKRMFKFLEGGEVNIQASFPAGVIGATLANLKAAAAGEHHEWSLLYPECARVAREEGFADVAAMYEAVVVAEKFHEKRYLALAGNLEAGRVFMRDQPVVWRCSNCGYLHVGTEAPKACRACLHPQGFFEMLAEPW